jgi:phosphoribosylamine--glycine ligase
LLSDEGIIYMKVLVIGSGGREHALVKKISQSKKLSKLFVAPGNAGMQDLAEVINIKADEIEKLADFAKENEVDLTIVGPEAPLVKGIVDLFEERNLKIFGPNKKAASLEASKIFTKDLCKKYNIPTADYMVFDDSKKAKRYIDKCNKPQVIKADGLAAGKGVVVAADKEEAKAAIDLMMEEKAFGDAAKKVTIEERLYGEEASILVLCDGEHICPLATSQDHKQIYDEDRGPNTGGMGAYSPAPIIDDGLYEDIMRDIIRPTIYALKEEGINYKGVLYAGLMMTESGPQLLEYNVRFGDPETQAILTRIESDFLVALEAAVDGKLDEVEIKWDERSCICVVIASGGYPGNYEKGIEIKGLKKAGKQKNVIVYHAGTKKENEKIYTNGGRVLGVTALGEDITQAIDRAYKAIEYIHFDKMYYRKDIGHKAVGK